MEQGDVRAAMSAAWPTALAGGLHDHRYAGGRRVREQLGEGGLADAALADVLVPVAGRAARVLRVVGVDQPQPVRADRGRPARPGSPSCRPARPGRGRPPRRGRCRSRRPSHGWPSTASRYGPRSSTRDGQDRPPPALGSTSSLGPPARRPSRAAAAAPRGPVASPSRRAPASTELPAWNTTAARADRLARGAARAPASATDRSTVAGVGEPRLTSSDGVDVRGDAPLGAAVAEQRVLRRVAVGQRPAARVGDVDLHGLRTGRVDVRQRSLGQPARVGVCVPDRPRGDRRHQKHVRW